jgi:hypothetical protein
MWSSKTPTGSTQKHIHCHTKHFPNHFPVFITLLQNIWEKSDFFAFTRARQCHLPVQACPIFNESRTTLINAQRQKSLCCSSNCTPFEYKTAKMRKIDITTGSPCPPLVGNRRSHRLCECAFNVKLNYFNVTPPKANGSLYCPNSPKDIIESRSGKVKN